MSTHTFRTQAVAALLGGCVATALQLSAQSPAGAEDRITKLEARVAALEREISSDTPLTVTAPFAVVDKNRKVILHVGGDAGVGVDLVVGSEKGARIGLNTSANVGAVSVVAPGQAEARLISGSDTGVEVRKAGGAARLNSTQYRIAFLGQSDDAGDTTSVVAVNNATGEPVAALYSDASGGRVEVADPTSTYTGAEISVGAEGGRVRVFEKASGTPVGGLFGGARGGGLALTGPGGGFSAVSLGVNKGGGAVRVFAAAGGPARAALEADAATGGVTAYDQKGNPAAILASVTGGSGIFQLLNAGVTMVEAGTSTDGVGLVQAGPKAGTWPDSLVPPSRLIGKSR